IRTLRCAFVALRKSHPVLIHKKSDLRVTFIMHAFGGFIMCLIMLMLLRVSTSESMIPRPCFQPLLQRLLSVLLLVTFLLFLFQITKTTFYHHCWGGVSSTCTPSTKLFSGTVISRILSSLRRTSAPIQLTIVLCVLGTQETSCILIAGLFERDTSQPTSPCVR